MPIDEMPEDERRDYIRRMLNPYGIEKAPACAREPEQRVPKTSYHTEDSHAIHTSQTGTHFYSDRKGRSDPERASPMRSGSGDAHQGTGIKRTEIVGK